MRWLNRPCCKTCNRVSRRDRSNSRLERGLADRSFEERRQFSFLEFDGEYIESWSPCVSHKCPGRSYRELCVSEIPESSCRLCKAPFW